MLPRTWFLAALLCLPAVRAQAADDGLVAHYPFNEGSGSVVRDASGHGNDGTLHGAKVTRAGSAWKVDLKLKDWAEIAVIE